MAGYLKQFQTVVPASRRDLVEQADYLKQFNAVFQPSLS